jgi:hypothetical protein
MLKKLVLLGVTLSVGLVFADGQSSAPVEKLKNKPTVGSKQGSDMMFGKHKLHAKHTENASKVERLRNKPTVGSKMSSEQTFGKHETSTTKGMKYYTDEELKNNPNSTVGSKMSSEQRFKPKPNSGITASGAK